MPSGSAVGGVNVIGEIHQNNERTATALENIAAKLTVVGTEQERTSKLYDVLESSLNALWRAVHVQIDPLPHVLEDEIDLRR